jgi:hypothetical protein
MNMVDEDSAVAEHCDELSLTCAMLGALDARGELSPALKVRLAEAVGLVAEGDQLDEARRKLRRARVGVEAGVRFEDMDQEDRVMSLHADCMAEAKQLKGAPVVATIFEGGPAKLLKPALEAQTKTVRAIVGKLETQDVYEGALRAKHVPSLSESADRADALLAAREANKREQEAAAARELDWKRRCNALRLAIGGQLMAEAADRGVAAPRAYARAFFSL